MMRSLFKSLLVLASLVGTYHFLDGWIESKMHLFTVWGISADLPYQEEWEVEKGENIKVWINQPYRYLTSGGQSFIFLSEDGQTVLKLFKMYRYHLPFNLPHQRRHVRLMQDFGSYALAYREFKEESGLLYLHLNKTDTLNQTLTVIDPIGIAHAINLDSTPFLLQKRVIPAYEALDAWITQGDLISAQEGMKNLLSSILGRYQKGIYDRDAVIETNYGFCGKTPILLDVGRLEKNSSYADPTVYQSDFNLIRGRLEVWLTQNHPKFLPFFREL